jgi:starvation-inducible DNA-binding protein
MATLVKGTFPMSTTQMTETAPPEGLPLNETSEVVEQIRQALAETIVTQMKAQNFHWNVTGMAFGSLHELFEEIYKDHFAAVDDLAERARALGAAVDGRFATFLDASEVEECEGQKSAREMVEILAADQRRLSATLRELADIAEHHEDVVTNDMAIERAGIHDKFAWMLAAHTVR